MTRRRLRALVLAAGFGTRLRPLTETVPKPALPVAGTAVAALTLERLAAAGCEAAAVNLHHRGERLRTTLGEAVGGMPITYSEEPEILGTLGAFAPLAGFVAGAELLIVVNGDSLCRWPLGRLLRAHSEGGAVATLLLAGGADPSAFGGGVGVDAAGDVVAFRPGVGSAELARHVFAGLHVLDPELVSNVGAGFADIVADLYEPLVARGGRLRGVVTRRSWHDLGTPERYRRGVLEHAFAGTLARRWVGAGAEVAAGARLRHAVVESGAAIGAGARVEASVVLPGARVGAAARVLSSIVGFGARIPDGARIDRQLVTPAAEAPAAEGSRLGELLLTPLAG